MSRIEHITSSLTFIPNSYEHSGSTNNFTLSGTVSNAYANADSTTELRLVTPATSRATSAIFFGFDLSSLSDVPSDATISSVTARSRHRVSNTTYISSLSVQLYNGTTAKGSATTTRTTGATTYDLTPGNWTRSELENARLYIKTTRNNRTNNAWVYFYGSDITVDFEYDLTYYAISTSSSVQGVGISAQDSETTSGGTDVITITGVSDLSDIKLMDNGTDVTSSLVRSGSNYTYTLNNVNADHVITVEDAITAKPLYLNAGGTMKLVSSIQKKTNNEWEAISFVDFWRKINGSYLNDSSISGKTTLIYGGEIETVSYDEVGTVNKTTSDLTITINDNALQSGTYKMFYEDTNRTIIDRIDEITEFTI